MIETKVLLTKKDLLHIAHDWLVVNKPVGLSVHNEGPNIIAGLKKLLPQGSFEDIYPVHRLDKETSGVLLVALKKHLATELAQAFEKHLLKKTYTAVLRGQLGNAEETGEWNLPLSDKAEGRRAPQGVLRDRKSATTYYKILDANKFFTLIEVDLLTGRQHQIRKHAVLAKHAIVGDDRYGDLKYNERMGHIYRNKRMYLHATRLEIKIQGKVHLFEAPLPPEFAEALKG